MISKLCFIENHVLCAFVTYFRGYTSACFDRVSTSRCPLCLSLSIVFTCSGVAYNHRIDDIPSVLIIVKMLCLGALGRNVCNFLCVSWWNRDLPLSELQMHLLTTSLTSFVSFIILCLILPLGAHFDHKLKVKSEWRTIALGRLRHY